MIEIERKFILRDAAVINELKARDIDVQQKEVTQIYVKLRLRRLDFARLRAFLRSRKNRASV